MQNTRLIPDIVLETIFVRLVSLSKSSGYQDYVQEYVHFVIYYEV